MSNMRIPSILSIILFVLLILIFAGLLTHLLSSDNQITSHSLNSEKVRESQEEARECIERGECDPLNPTPHGVEVTDGEAPDAKATYSGNEEPNPDYDGTEPSTNPQLGTTNDPDSDEAHTGESSKTPNTSPKQRRQV